MNLYKKSSTNTYSFLVKDTTPPFDNTLRFNNLSGRKISRRWMVRLELKNYNTILIEKQQKYRHYYQVKLMDMNILQVKKYYLLIKIK